MVNPVILRTPVVTSALLTLTVARLQVGVAEPVQQEGASTTAVSVVAVYLFVLALVTGMVLISMTAVAAAPLPPPPLKLTEGTGVVVKLPRLTGVTDVTGPDA